MKLTIAVIGAGISGVSFAKIASEQFDVTVYEQRKDIGGLINCERVNGYLYHKVGGHVFNSKNQQVLDWFWQFFDKETEFIKTKRLAKVLINDKLVGYPIEDHLFEFNRETIIQIINELLFSGSNNKQGNFEEFLKNNFGETLYQLYFKPYNKKIWNVDLSTVPLEWLQGKLPMPNIKDILLNNILRKEDDNMVHSFFYYPKINGSQFIIDRLATGVFIKKDIVIKTIEIRENTKIYINGEGPFDKLVYTGDVRELPSLFVDASVFNINKECIKSFRSNGTTNVLCSCDNNDLSWLYVPETKFKAHRIIYTGNFSHSNNGMNDRSSCTVEFSNFITQDEAIEEIKMLPGNLKFVAYNYEPNSYVIQDDMTKEVIDGFKRQLHSHNIFLLGRFAEWEYYNMDKAIEAAFFLANNF